MADNLIVTHREDLDGIIVATLASQGVMQEGKTCEYIFVSYFRQKDIFWELSQSNLQNKIVYILDLSANDCLFEQPNSIVENLINNAKEIIWVDHHNSSKLYAKKMREWGVKVFLPEQNELICASMLFARNFLNDRDVTKLTKLINIAQAHDYDKTIDCVCLHKTAVELQKIISLYNYQGDETALKDLILSFINNDWGKNGELADFLQNNLTEYNALENEAIHDFNESLTTIEVGDQKFMIAYGHPILPLKNTARDFREKNAGKADGYIIIFGDPTNNALCLKEEKKSDFNALKFCEFMGGGGRENSGGFSFAEKITLKNYPNAKNVIFEGLSKFLT